MTGRKDYPVTRGVICVALVLISGLALMSRDPLAAIWVMLFALVVKP